MPKAWVIGAGIGLGLAGALATIRLNRHPEFTDTKAFIDVYSPGGDPQSHLRAWKFRDGLTTCYVFLTRSRDLITPSADCSLFFP